MTNVYRGVVRGDAIVLPYNVRLPDQAIVEVRIISRHRADVGVWARLDAQRAANARYHIGIDEILEEDRQEREEHPDTWMGAGLQSAS